MAWLNAAPKPPEGSRRAEMKSLPPPVSRAETLKRDKIIPQMPPNPAPHIIERLVEMGLTEAVGMGSAPLSWVTLAAWQSVTGTSIAPWEARLIRKLSSEYLAQSRLSEVETCPPPWKAEITEREKQVEIERLRMVLG